MSDRNVYLSYKQVHRPYHCSSIEKEHLEQRILSSCHIEIGTVSLPASSRCVRVSEVGYHCVDHCTSTAADLHSGLVLRELVKLWRYLRPTGTRICSE